MIEGRDIVFLSNIPWEFSFQRHQQLASRLARRNRVLFVEPAASPLLLIHHRGFFSRAFRKAAQGIRPAENNLFLFTPPPLLPGGGRFLPISRLNQRFLTRAVRRVMGRLNFSSPLIWNFSPYYSGPARDLPRALTIYDCTDEMVGERAGMREKLMSRLERETLSGADLVFTTSRYLYRTRRAYHPRVYFLPNGADIDRYLNSLPAEEVDLPEIDRLPSPRIGFSGTFNSLQDQELLYYLASRRPSWSFVFIGTTTAAPGRLARLPNVHFLGNKPVELLPRYLRRFSVGIMPFRMSRETEGIHPLKAYDYLCLGLPVVSTPLPECGYFEKNIRVAANPGEFLSSLEDSLRPEEAKVREARIAFARANSWDARAEEAGRIIESRLRRKTIKVLAVSHSAVVSGYRERFAEVARSGEVALTVLAPLRWRQFNREIELERNGPAPYRLVGRRPLTWGFQSQRWRNVTHIYPHLKKLLREVRPDIIEIWEEPFAAVTARIIRAARKVLPEAGIIFFSAQNIRKNYPPPFRRWERYTYRHADFALVMNEEAGEVIKEKGWAGESLVLPLGVNPRVFKMRDASELRQKLKLDRFTVGFAGKFERQKGISVLLRAAGRLKGQIKIILIGSGPQKAELRRLARQLEIEDDTCFLPPVEHDKLPLYLNCLDVLVLPSITLTGLKEQFGRVLIEAMACGVPVIGSSSGEIPRVIGEAGLVFPEGESGELAARIESLREDLEERRRLGEAGRKRVERNFTWEILARRQIQLYRKLITSRPSAGRKLI